MKKKRVPRLSYSSERFVTMEHNDALGTWYNVERKGKDKFYMA